MTDCNNVIEKEIVRPLSKFAKNKVIQIYLKDSIGAGHSIEKINEIADKLSKVIWSKVDKTDIIKVINNDLKLAIKDIYRDGESIGNGSTADAIRYEAITGIQVGTKWHKVKGYNSINRLENLLKDGKLSDGDKNIATKIILDIKNAIDGN